MKINEKGYWENETAEGHGHDEGLANAICDFLISQPKDFINISVLDIGCGDGYYVNKINDLVKFADNGYAVCHGVDGNPYTYEISNNNWNLSIYDLTKPLPFLHRYDWVLSLEVGEHIPAEYEDVFLDNLHNHNKHGIILSWAIRGQGGDGHVNCKDNHEIIDKITAMGYTYDENSTQVLRSKCATYPNTGWWFRNTLMVFRRNT